MSKVKEMVKAMITKEQLKTVVDQQSKLNEILRTLGVLDVQKMNLHDKVKDVSSEIEATKKELEEEYGKINIDLKDGSYTDIEEEDDK
jgi:hypothetical protein